ncbi:hypothetical protein M9H77_00370 [Catharanthus roseus]|nr:hypothetical protein M9H77_00368 [Catharanthus roseus]KAI5640998.1 hypothetical protein M9H77_00370 [Catharanthus roseus]
MSFSSIIDAFNGVAKKHIILIVWWRRSYPCQAKQLCQARSPRHGNAVGIRALNVKHLQNTFVIFVQHPRARNALMLHAFSQLEGNMDCAVNVAVHYLLRMR